MFFSSYDISRKIPMKKNNFVNSVHLYTVLLAITVIFSIIIIGLTAATLIIVTGSKKDPDENQIRSTTAIPVVSVTSTDRTSTLTPVVSNKNLMDTINSTQLMFHLNQLQIIADKNNGTRAFATSGFTATIDYIENQLRTKTNFEILKQEFMIPTQVKREPSLTVIIAGIESNYIYETDYSEALLSPPTNFSTSIRLTMIPNSGCENDDWQHATPYPAANSVALVQYDKNCTILAKSIIAQQYNISGLLLYDTNINATDLPTVFVAQNTTYPAMIVSYKLGTKLVEAIQNHSSSNASIRMFIAHGNTITVSIPAENLCADTPTGDRTQTIIIGSHSDSIDEFPGINDNGRLFTT